MKGARHGHPTPRSRALCDPRRRIGGGYRVASVRKDAARYESAGQSCGRSSHFRMQTLTTIQLEQVENVYGQIAQFAVDHPGRPNHLLLKKYPGVAPEVWDGVVARLRGDAYGIEYIRRVKLVVTRLG
jgi:hypothetical protein